MFRKILVPYDYSEQSHRALGHAFELAGSSPDCKVVVFNTLQEVPAHIGMRMALDGEGESEEVREFREDSILNLKKDATRAIGEGAGGGGDDSSSSGGSGNNFNVTYDVIIGGHPSDRILEVEKKESADLIVMGSVGRSGLRKLTKMGGVSRKVVEGSKCPVLIVH